MTYTKRRELTAIVVLLAIGCFWRPAWLRAQSVGLTGGWTLDRQRSQFPREPGFGLAWLPPDVAAGQAQGGADGQRGSSSPVSADLPRLPESEQDAARVQLLTAEVREPAQHLTIADTASGVTMADDRGQWRTLRVDGTEQTLSIGGVPVPTVARRLPDGLEVTYQVEDQRQLRYVYSRVQSPPQLVVDVQFLDHGKGDTIRRVYEPSSWLEQEPAFGAPASASATGIATAGTGTNGTRSAAGRPGVPASGDATQPPVNQRPDAALDGLTELTVDIEGIDSDGTSCGLQQSAIKSAVSKHLSDAGLKVADYSDKDTYLNVKIITAKLSNGLCVSRYDVSLDTQTAAKLSYAQTPVPVQATLLRKGGLAGSDAATHAAEVLRGVLSYVDQFATRIHNASKP